MDISVSRAPGAPTPLLLLLLRSVQSGRAGEQLVNSGSAGVAHSVSPTRHRPLGVAHSLAEVAAQAPQALHGAKLFPTPRLPSAPAALLGGPCGGRWFRPISQMGKLTPRKPLPGRDQKGEG